MLRNIYTTNLTLSKFFNEKDPKCTMCNQEDETLVHLYYDCMIVKKFWSNVEQYIYQKTNYKICLESQNIITYFTHNNKKLEFLVNLYILIGKYYIHKTKYNKSKLSIKVFLLEIDTYLITLLNVSNTKSVKTLEIMRKFRIIDA